MARDRLFGLRVIVAWGLVFLNAPPLMAKEFGVVDDVYVGRNTITPFGGLGRFQNLLLRSEEFNDAAWVKSASTTSTTDTIVAPDGTTTAEAITFGSAGLDSLKQISTTAAGSTQFTGSVWLKAASGAPTVRLGLLDEAAAATYANAVLDTTWQRFQVTKTFSAATGNAVLMIEDNTDASGTLVVHAWGAQLESAIGTAGVYARTTTVAVRQPRIGMPGAAPFGSHDVDRDGDVDGFDVRFVLARVGCISSNACWETIYAVDNLGNPIRGKDADINGNGAVSIGDAGALSVNYPLIGDQSTTGLIYKSAVNGDTINLYLADTATAGAANATLDVSDGNLLIADQLGVSNLGIEFTESDTNPACASGTYTIYADLSDGKLKKCEGATLSDLATGTGGSGTVTSVGSGRGLTGGAITTSGTLTFDYSATLASDPAYAIGEVTFADETASGLLFEGPTADTFEGLLTASPTASDKTWTLPDVSGTLAVSATSPVVLNVTTGNLTLTQHAGTNVATDLEEETHASEHDGTGLSVSSDTLNFASTEIGSTTWGAADGTWTFDSTSGTNPTLAWTDNQLNLGGNLDVSGNVALGNNAAIVSTSPLNINHNYTDPSGTIYMIEDTSTITLTAPSTAALTGVHSRLLTAVGTTNSLTAIQGGNFIAQNRGDAAVTSVYGSFNQAAQGAAIGVPAGAGTTTTMVGTFSQATNNATTAGTAITNMYGDYSYLSNRGPGTIANAQGLRVELVQANGGSGAGTITDLRGVNIDTTNLTAGTVTTSTGVYVPNMGTTGGTTAYGLYVGDQTSATNKYPIYQTGTSGVNILNANTRLGGTTAPTSALSVTGNVDISGTLTVGGAAAGTVTSVGSGRGLTGGAITTSGTLTFDYSATLASDPAYAIGEVTFADETASGLLFEGPTADTFEGLLTASPTASDKTWTLPDLTGTIPVLQAATPGTQQTGHLNISGVGLFNQVKPTIADNDAVVALSGNAGNWTAMSIGRTAAESKWGVAQGAGAFASDAQAGDIILRAENTANKLRLLSGAGASALSIAAASPHVSVGGDLDVSGHGAIGGTASVASTEILRVGETFTADAANYGLRLTPTFDSSAVDGFTSHQVALAVSPTADRDFSLLANLIAVDTSMTTTNTTAAAFGPTSAVGLRVSGNFSSGPPLSSYGLQVNNLGAAGITDTYGLYIADQTNSTNNYPIYQAGTNGTNVLKANTTMALTSASGTSGVANMPYSLLVDEATTNLVANPSFDDATVGTASWTAVGTTTVARVTTPTPYIGVGALSVTKPIAADGNGVETTPPMAVLANTMYVASVYLRQNATGDGNDTLKLSLIGDNSLATDSAAFTLIGVAWRRYLVTKTTSVSDTTLQLRIKGSGVQDLDFLVDAVQLEAKAGYATSYADGSFGPGYTWSGTAHNSTSSRTAGLKYLGGPAAAKPVLYVPGNAYFEGGSGDVNNNGVLNSNDATFVNQYLAGINNFTPEEYARADVNGDGIVTVTDRNLISLINSGTSKYDAKRQFANVAGVTTASTFTVLQNLDVDGTANIDNALTVASYGIEFTEADANQPACGAGNYSIYADTSDGKLKKCQNGTLTDLATGTGGSGTVTSVATGTGLTGGTITTTGTIALDYSSTLASNPGLVAGQATFADETASGVIFEGSVADTFEGLLTASPTASDKTWTLPDVSGTLAVSATSPVVLNVTTGNLTLTQHAGTNVTADLEEEGQINATAVTGNVANAQLLIGTGASTAGWVGMSGDLAITNAGATTIQANSVALGTDTANDYVAAITAGTGLASTGATSGETISHTLSLDTTAALSGDHALNANEGKFGQSGLIFEGSGADTIETFLAVTNPTTTDKTITLPDLTGTVALLQSSTPGTQQTGHLNLSGTGIFGGDLTASGDLTVQGGDIDLTGVSATAGLDLTTANADSLTVRVDNTATAGGADATIAVTDGDLILSPSSTRFVSVGQAPQGNAKFEVIVGNQYAIYGETTNGLGLYGKATNLGTGIYGEATNNGHGIEGRNGNTTTGFAGYFSGRGYFSNNVGIGSESQDPAAQLELGNTGRAKGIRFGGGQAAPATLYHAGPDTLATDDTLLARGGLVTPYGGLGRFQNLLLRSEEFNDAAWVKSASVTSTTDTIAGPTGLTDAEAVTFGTAGLDSVKQDSNITAASTQFTGSVWLKAASGTPTVRLGVIDEAGTPAGTYANAALTTDWQRFQVTHTFAVGATGTANLIVDDNTDASGTLVVHAWGTQLESGVGTAGVYGPTSASIARYATYGGSVAQMAFDKADVNRDGYVDSLDRDFINDMSLLSCAIGQACWTTVYGVTSSGSPLMGQHADVNGDGGVGAQDLQTTVTPWNQPTLHVLDGGLLSLSAVNPNTTTEGLLLPQATVCTGATAEGQVCWDTDNDSLYLGTGAAAQVIGGAGGAGTVTSVGSGTGLTGGPITGSGTLALDYSATLAANPALAASEATFASTGIIFEGSGADTNEGLLTVTNPTSDKTWTLPDVSGTLAVSATSPVVLNVTTGNLTLTQDAGTNVATDLEEETHGAEHDGTDGDYVTDAGDTMTGALTFNVVGTDITTVTDADLTIDAAGAGKTIIADTLQVNSNAIADSGGTTRVTLATASPHVSLTGDADVSGHAAIGNTASVGTGPALQISEDNTNSQSDGIDIVQNYTGTAVNAVSRAIDATVSYAGTAGSGNAIIGASLSTNQNSAQSLGTLRTLQVQTKSTATTGVGAIAAAQGILVVSPGYAGAIPTTQNGILISNQGVAGMTDAYGLNIADQTGSTNNYAIYLAGTGGTPSTGITFGADTNLYRSAANVLATDDALKIKTAGVATLDGANPTPVTIGVTMPDATYAVQLTPTGTLVNNADQPDVCKVSNKTTTTFDISCFYEPSSSGKLTATTSATATVDWLVIDY